MQLLKNFTSSRFVFRFSTTGGSLYTWGKNTSSLGYSVPQQTTQLMKPQKVQGFKNNVQQVVMGQNHSALLTTSGELYTWGSGKYGVLGHNDDKSYVEPKLIEFFVKKNLTVIEVALGEHHSMALTQDGDVWTWGYGGREQNFLMDLLFLQVGSLGHGDNKTRYTPTPVESLRSLPPIKHIGCGHRFANAMNANNEIYNWGKGDYGVFGDGNNKSHKTPQFNTYFEYLKKEQNMTIVKMLSCNNYSLALMSDGQLYGWGSNENGQMGIKTEIGVEMYETANFPTLIVHDPFKDNKIQALTVAEDITAVLLDNNEVHWSGSKLVYKPERFPVPKEAGKILHIGACFRSVVAATEDGKIYFRNRFVQEEEENMSTGVQSATIAKLFGDGEMLSIGGTYRNRYTIWRE